MRIELISFREEFTDLFIRWRGEPATVRHNPLAATNPEKIRKTLESEGSDLSDLPKFENYRWFIQLGVEVVGNVSLKNISHSMGYAEIGYGISRDYYGRGIATEAICLLVRKAFEESSLRKLFAYVHDKNVPSCRVLEKNGFKKEGFLREHYIINGKPENEIFYGLLKHEWEPLQSSLR